MQNFFVNSMIVVKFLILFKIFGFAFQGIDQCFIQRLYSSNAKYNCTLFLYLFVMQQLTSLLKIRLLIYR